MIQQQVNLFDHKIDQQMNTSGRMLQGFNYFRSPKKYNVKKYIIYHQPEE